ncbi:NIF3-like protein [Haemophilus parahaemolyticus]|uniref:GTP cyclohydrolase 1 type 2 homolog n=1 Tax=Haemophilus parahaemolyticus TaxID=735 RepID=A0A377I0Z9_HAEPH|nr:NIF3-like protein [Haemophilus parahaemolyticus]
MLTNIELEQILDTKLNAKQISDYAPNGLQVEGRKQIQKIVTGVTATLPLIEKAIELNADAILVHHGYFWKSETPCIRGMKGKRIKQLLVNDINLFSYHLPLDVHPELGNNAQLANHLGVRNLMGLEDKPNSIPVYGELETPISAQKMAKRIEKTLNRQPILCDEFIADYPHKLIKTVAICTGGGKATLILQQTKALMLLLQGNLGTNHTLRS